jgi:predicted component of type VI protein secretion system
MSNSELAQAIHDLAQEEVHSDFARDAIASYAREIQDILNVRLNNSDEHSFAMLFEARDALYRAQSGLTPAQQAERRLEALMLGEDSIWNY